MSSHLLTATFTRAKADSETRSVPAVLSTETPVKRGDYQEILAHKTDSVDLSRFPLPVLVGHDSDKINIGIAENPIIDGGRLRADVRFGASEQARQLFEDVKSGIVRGLSVGYQWLDFIETGMTTTVTRWQPFEVSIIAIPADQNAGFYRGKTMPDQDQNTGADDAKTATPGDDNTHQRAIKKERERIARIRKFGQMSSTDEAVINDLIERGVGKDEAVEVMNEKWCARVDAETSRGDTGHYCHSRGAAHEDIRAAIVDGLLMRSGIPVEKPHAAAADFQSTSILEIAKILLRDRGDYGTNQSPAAILKRSMSTSDLPDLLSNVANKAMIAGFDGTETTHDAFVTFRQVADFKPQSRLALSAFESLLETHELGEVIYSALNEAKETYQIASYQRAISFSRQMLINDDLSQLTDMPARMGAAAKRKESDLVYSILTGSHIMADTIELFAAARGNLIANVLDAAGLSAAVSVLRKAKDIGGFGYLGLRPKWLVVGPDQEMAALQLLATLNNPTANAAAVPGSDFARINLIVEPRIESPSIWFLLGEGMERIEVGHLDANGISFESEQSFNDDATHMKVRLDAGAKALSPLAMVKSTGAG
ncbi:HK97 family phage prohead protease [Candidatus Methylobacter favarea]|nr:HK97 family phage prohead protease [Candidatus Methylobacter favarea]